MNTTPADWLSPVPTPTLTDRIAEDMPSIREMPITEVVAEVLKRYDVLSASYHGSSKL